MIELNGLVSFLTFFLAVVGVHIVHTSRVIIAYTLESLSSLTQITHNIQATINFKKKDIKKETQKDEGIRDSNSTSVYNDSKYLTSSLTEIEPHTTTTNQPEEVRRKYNDRKEYKETNLE